MTIAQLEALNLATAVRALLPKIPHHHVIYVNTDNAESQQVLTSGAGHDPILAAWARQIWLIAERCSADIQIHHKPGKNLVLADALSRCHHDPRAFKVCNNILVQRGLLQVHVDFSATLTTDL